MAPKATINPISAYSIRSWPDSSVCRFFNMLIIVNISLFSFPIQAALRGQLTHSSGLCDVPQSEQKHARIVRLQRRVEVCLRSAAVLEKLDEIIVIRHASRHVSCSCSPANISSRPRCLCVEWPCCRHTKG